MLFGSFYQSIQLSIIVHPLLLKTVLLVVYLFSYNKKRFMTVNTNSQFVLFLYSESETPPGSLKRLGSARQLPADLRALQNPLNTTFNPEGIYVWFPTISSKHILLFLFVQTMKVYFCDHTSGICSHYREDSSSMAGCSIDKTQSDWMYWMYAKLSPDPKLRKASPWTWPLLNLYRKDAASVYVLPIDLLMQVRENSIMMSFFQECLWISR